MSGDGQPGYRAAYDADAERAVLGVCLLGRVDTVQHVRAILPDANPFYLPKHATIWACICTIVDDGGTPDLVTVAARMPRFQHNWDAVQDRLYLHELYDRAPVGFNTHHARIVADFFAARAIVEMGIRLQQIGSTGDISQITDLVEQVKTQVGSINTSGARRAPWHDLLQDGAQFVLDAPDNPPAIWGASDGRVLWASGESLVIAGPPGVGKSTVAGQLVAARIGLINSVLGFSVKPGNKKLLYLAGDRPAQISRSLRRTLNRPEWYDQVRDRLIVWRGPPPSLFTEKPQLLKEMALDADADTVVIDSVKDVGSGLTEDVPAAAYNSARQRLLAAADIELLELHHIVKRGPNGQAPIELADIYGNQQLTGGAGSVVLFWGAAGDPLVRLLHLKQPQLEVGPLQITHDHDKGMSYVKFMPDLVAMATKTPAGTTAVEVAQVIFEKKNPTQGEVEKARRRLDRLVTGGKLFAGHGRSGDTSVITYHGAASEDDEEDERERYR